MIKIDAKYSISGNLAITATSPVPILSAGFYIIKAEDPNDIQTYNILDRNTDLTILPGYVSHTIIHGNSWIYNDIKKSGIYIIVVKTNTDISYQILKIITKLSVFNTKIFDESKKGANDGSISVILEGGNSPYTYLLCPKTPILDALINKPNFNPSNLENKHILKTGTIASPVISLYLLTPNDYILFIVEAERTDAGYSSFLQIPFVIKEGINALAPFDINKIKLSDPTHINYSDGIISFNVESGVGLINFQLLLASNNSSVGITNKKLGDKVYFDNLPANDYILIGKDEKGYTQQINLTLNSSLVQELSGNATIQPPSDILLKDGKIILNYNGGISPYIISLYEIIPLRLRTITDNKLINKETVNTNTYTFNNLIPNSYLVSIKESSERNANELKFELIVPEVQLNTLAANATPSAPETIDGKGLVNLSISGGNRDELQNVQIMIYAFDGSNRLFKDSQKTNKNLITWRLSPGNYQAIIKDLTNEISVNFTIPPYNYTKLSFNTPLVQMIDCLSISLGGFSVGILDGIEPFTWTLDNKINKSNATFTNNNRDLTVTNLPIGKYLISVKDKAGDEIQLQLPIEINPMVMTLNLNILNSKNIHEEEDLGWFSFIVNGGCYPYTYVLSKANDNTFATITQKSKLDNETVLSHTFNNLKEGTYLLSITDANLNTTTETIKIENYVNEPLKLVKNTFSNSTTLSNNNGIIHLSVLGGTPPYSYFIDDLNSPYTFGPVISGLTDYNFFNLTPSKYKISITDSSLPFSTTIDFETYNYEFNNSLQDNDLIFYGSTNETGIQSKDGSITITPNFLSENLLVYLYNMKDGQKVTSTNTSFINPIKYPDQLGATWQNLSPGEYMVLALKKDHVLSYSYIYQKEFITIEKYPIPQIIASAYKASDSEWNSKTGSIYYNLTTTGIGPYRIEITNANGILVYREITSATSDNINNLDMGTYEFKISDLGYFNDPDLPNSLKTPYIVSNIVINKLFDIVSYNIKNNNQITIELSPVGSGQVTNTGFSVYLLSKTDFPSNPVLSSGPFTPNYANYITPNTNPTLSRLITIETTTPDDYWILVIDESNQKVSREITIYPFITATYVAINPTVEGNLINGAIYITATGGSTSNYTYELYKNGNPTPFSINTTGEFTNLSVGNYNILVKTTNDLPYGDLIILVDNSISCVYTDIRNYYGNVTGMYFNDTSVTLGNSINEDYWIYTELWSRIPVRFEEKYGMSSSLKLELEEDNGTRTGYFLHNFINTNENNIVPRFLFWQYYFSLTGSTNYKANLKYAIQCPIPKSIINEPPSLEITDINDNTAYYLGKHNLLNFTILQSNDLANTNNGSISGIVNGGTPPYILEVYETIEDYYLDKNNNQKTIYHKNQNRDRLIKTITVQNTGDSFNIGGLEGFYYNSTLMDWEKRFYYIKIIDSSQNKLSNLTKWNTSYKFIGDIIHNVNNVNQHPGSLSVYSNKIYLQNKSPYLTIQTVNNPTPVNNSNGTFRIYLNNYNILENSNLQSLKLFTASYTPIQTCCIPNQQLTQNWLSGSEPNQFYTEITNVSSVDNLSYILNYQRNGIDYYITLTPFTLNEVIFDKIPLAINNFDNQSLIGDNTIRTYMNDVISSNNNWIDRNNLYQKNELNKLIYSSIVDSNQGLIHLSINDKASSLTGLNITFETYNSLLVLQDSFTQLYTGTTITYEYKPTINGLYKIKITAGSYITEQWYNIQNLNQEFN